MTTPRSGSFGQHVPLSPLDRLGTWWGRRAMARRVGPLTGRRVADLGCGYEATLGRTIAHEVMALTLVDLDLNADLEALPNTSLIRGRLPDALEGLHAQGHDVVVLSSVLEHLDDDQVMLDACRRLLAPGGVLFVNVPSWWGKSALEFSAFRLGLSPAEEMNDHRRYYDPRDLWPKLVAAGFVPEDIVCRRHKLGLNTWATARLPASPG
ncbi:MAG: methyltransferase domain-containing protein [Microthrixaceae bacterium]